MGQNSLFLAGFCMAFAFTATNVWASGECAISGLVQSEKETSIQDASIQLRSHGHLIKATRATGAGDFEFFPIDHGNYQITVQAPGFIPYQSSVHVLSGATTRVSVQLRPILYRAQAKRDNSKRLF